VANDVDDLAEKRPKSARVRPGHRGEGAASAGPGRPQVVATTGRRLQQHERARCARLVVVGGRDTQAHPELWGPLPQPVDVKWLPRRHSALANPAAVQSGSEGRAGPPGRPRSGWI
jgi:hypothetical protein